MHWMEEVSAFDAQHCWILEVAAKELLAPYPAPKQQVKTGGT